jgi:predicted membrane protein
MRRERRTVGGVFAVVLVLVVCATGASFLATTLLGLIAFVPLFGFIFIPLSLLAWMLRAIVFQYIGLSSIGAYLKLYREANPGLVEGRVPMGTPHGHDRLREVSIADGTSIH